MQDRRPSILAGRIAALAAAMAGAAAAQTRIAGWAPNAFDSSFSAEAFAEVETSAYTTVARRSNGTIAAWGLLGAPITDVPALPPGVSIVDIAVVTGQCTALLSTGDAISWPNGETYDFTAPILQLSAGDGHMLALFGTGTVFAWGSNNHGQLLAPPLPPGVTYVEVAGGVTHSLARRSDGQVVSFGSMTTGATPPPGTAFVQITGGKYHSAGLLDTGDVIAWGITNLWGQLDVPPLPPGLTYVKIDAGPGHTLALRSDGSVVGWGANAGGQIDVPPLPPGTTYTDVSAGGTSGTGAEQYSYSYARRSDGTIVGFGWNGYGQLNAPAAALGLDYVEVSTSGVTPDLGGPLTFSHTAARRSNGTIVVFGDDSYGQDLVPALPPGLTYVEVDAGGLHNVARRSNGTVVAWGNNSWGQTSGIPGLPIGRTYIQVAAGAYHSHALRDDGIVVGWGYSGAPLTAPPLPPGVAYVEVDLGTGHSLARRSDGTVVGWGSNTFGQLNVPALPPGTTYVDIACGGYHNLARRSDGAVVAWGYNAFGQTDVPTLPPGVTCLEIAAGPLTSAARLSSGQVLVWGIASNGQQAVPALATGEACVQLAAGNGGLVMLVDTVWSAYGVGKTNSLGCVPAIAAAGAPSASESSGFTVRCEQVRNQAPGMLIYTVNGNQASTPFQCASLLVGPSGVRRSPIRSAGGSALPAADCTGVFTLDMNAFGAGAAGGVPHPALQAPGTVVHAQWWGRDNGFPPPCNTMLSNAIEYVVR